MHAVSTSSRGRFFGAPLFTQHESLRINHEPSRAFLQQTGMMMLRVAPKAGPSGRRACAIDDCQLFHLDLGQDDLLPGISMPPLHQTGPDGDQLKLPPP